MMAELHRRTESKEQMLRQAIRDADEKLMNLNSLVAQLDTRGPASCATGSPLPRVTEPSQAEPGASQISTAPASPRSATSISSNLSERIQACINTKLERLRTELVSVSESMERRVTDDVYLMLGNYVEDHEMYAAIEDAVDGAMASIRERVLETWG